METTNMTNLKDLESDSDEHVSKTVPRDINEVIRNAGMRRQGRYVNAAEVEKGLKKVEVIKVMSAYDKEFTDAADGTKRMRTFIDISVRSLSDYRNGEELVFSLGTMQVETMSRLFGQDHTKWIGARMRLLPMPTQKGKTIVIDRD